MAVAHCRPGVGWSCVHVLLLLLAWSAVVVVADFSYDGFGPAYDPIVGIKMLGSAKLQRCTGDLPSALDPSVLLRTQQNGSTTISVTAFTQQVICPVGNCSCMPSLGLTEARAAQAGAAWHITKQPVAAGFSTRFRFRMVNQSQVCEQRVEQNAERSALFTVCSTGLAPAPSLSTSGKFTPGSSQEAPTYTEYAGSHATTQRHGGDGFAFVMHNSANGSSAYGGTGGGLGYAGIDNSLVVEFDTYANLDATDTYSPHISVHSSGPSSAGGIYWTRLAHSVGAVSPDDDGSGTATNSTFTFGDGDVHQARIAMWPTIKYDYLALGKFAAEPYLATYLRDAIGTLCIFLDELSTPLYCVPLALEVVLALDSGRAFIGFTASTGHAYQTHDILDWHFCTSPDTC